MLLFCAKSNAQEYYVKYGINDCINCSSQLYALQNQLSDKEINFIFPSKYKDDSLIVEGRFGLNQFKHRILFSDSLYTHWQKGMETYFIIVKDDTPVYTTKLKETSKEEFKKNIALYDKRTDTKPINTYSSASALNAEEKKQESFCMVNNGSVDGFSIFDSVSFLTLNGSLNHYTYHDINNASDIAFLPDTNTTKMIYKTFYGDKEYREHYNLIRQGQQNLPGMNSQFDNVFKNKQELYFLTTGYFVFNINIVNNDSNISVGQRPFLLKYSLQQKEFTNCYFVKGIDSIFYISPSYIKQIGELYYMPIKATRTDSSSKIMATFKIHNDSLVLNEILPFTIPENYIKYKLYDNFKDPVYDGNLFAFARGEVVYDLATKQTYKLPLQDNEYTELENLLADAMAQFKTGKVSDTYYFYISALCDDNENYKVLYFTKNKEYYTITVNKKTGKLLSKTKVPINEDEIVNVPKYFPNDGNEIIYLKQGETCFSNINVE